MVFLNPTAFARIRTAGYTGFALVAFAANSVLCRLALGKSLIDAASFSTIRLASGALVLLLLAGAVGRKNAADRRDNWTSAVMLFVYAAAFSFAYTSLSAGTGALILFASVQATMIIFAMFKGERLRLPGFLGLLAALSGLICLVFPGLRAPSPGGAALMTAAGIAWGAYSLRGRGVKAPVAVTANNFLRATPFALFISLIFSRSLHLSMTGVLYACLSGGLTSAVGYAVWYAALKDLAATPAAMVQLIVPVLAALGGVVFLSEQPGMRLVLSSVMIIGGVALALARRSNSLHPKSST